MRPNDINNVFKAVFNKNLHVTLRLRDKTNFSKEFLKEFEAKYRNKEIPMAGLTNTILDTNRWEFGTDLSVLLNSTPVFNQKTGSFESDIIIFADIEPKVEHYSGSTLLSLMRFIKPNNRSDYFDYIKELKSTWRK